MLAQPGEECGGGGEGKGANHLGRDVGLIEHFKCLPSASILSLSSKLDGVGPVDNSPSNN